MKNKPLLEVSTLYSKLSRMPYDKSINQTATPKEHEQPARQATPVSGHEQRAA